ARAGTGPALRRPVRRARDPPGGEPRRAPGLVTTRARDAGPFGREIEHTADLGLEIEAPTLAALFERAGLAMLGLTLDVAPLAPREQRTLSLAADGLEELFRDWLQTLLVQLQADGFAACELDVTHVDEHGVRATAAGERVDPSRHH